MCVRRLAAAVVAVALLAGSLALPVSAEDQNLPWPDYPELAEDAERTCADFSFMEDAQLFFQDSEECTELTPRAQAATCDSFTLRDEAERWYRMDPWGYRHMVTSTEPHISVCEDKPRWYDLGLDGPVVISPDYDPPVRPANPPAV